MDVSNKEVRFDKWCENCKHYVCKFPGEDFFFEAQEPCNTCLEAIYAVRDGSEKPEYWEAK